MLLDEEENYLLLNVSIISSWVFVLRPHSWRLSWRLRFSLFLQRVQHPQENITFTLRPFFSTGSWAFWILGSSSLRCNTQNFKRESWKNNISGWLWHLSLLPPGLMGRIQPLCLLIRGSLAAGMEPSCRPLRFFTNLEKRKTSGNSERAMQFIFIYLFICTAS